MLPKEERENPEGITFPLSSAVPVEISDDELVSHVLDILSSKEQVQLAIFQLLKEKKYSFSTITPRNLLACVCSINHTYYFGLPC